MHAHTRTYTLIHTHAHTSHITYILCKTVLNNVFFWCVYVCIRCQCCSRRPIYGAILHRMIFCVCVCVCVFCVCVFWFLPHITYTLTTHTHTHSQTHTHTHAHTHTRTHIHIHTGSWSGQLTNWLCPCCRLQLIVTDSHFCTFILAPFVFHNFRKYWCSIKSSFLKCFKM